MRTFKAMFFPSLLGFYCDGIERLEQAWRNFQFRKIPDVVKLGKLLL